VSSLQIKDLHKTYGDTPILEGIDLELAAGEFCTIVGASGCGKSTLLRLLLGQESPTKGELLLNGEPLAGEPTPQRGIVFQRYSVFRHLTVAENVRLGLELRDGGRLFGFCFGAKRRAIKQQGTQLLEAVGLSGSARNYPAELSGGMQQRLALAQAIARRPPLLLLDEPFGALDPGNRHAMHALLRELWQASGMTVVMVTHDLPEAFSLGTRMLVLDRPTAASGRPRGARITYDLPVGDRCPGHDNRSDVQPAEYNE